MLTVTKNHESCTFKVQQQTEPTITQTSLKVYHCPGALGLFQASLAIFCFKSMHTSHCEMPSEYHLCSALQPVSNQPLILTAATMKNIR